MTYEVSDVAFEPDGTALITFMERTDVRCGGAVAVRQTIRIVPTAQYAEGVQELLSAVQRLLTDAHEDWRQSDPVPVDDMDSETAVRGTVDEDLDELDSPAARQKWEQIEASRDRAGS